MVIAIARLCGVDTLPENFNRPYLARNVMDFWTRWHMSFGTWIRHYVFTPMSKHLMKAAPPAAHNLVLAVTVIVTFVIVGAWHGTTLNFIVFGLLHGGAIIVISAYGRVLKTLLDRKRRKAFETHPLVHAVSIVLCFHFVCATILLFPNSVGDLTAALDGFLRIQGWR
jgi:D-alanyl-lipoteichoic acid acyltransferase DltB (MBOAT superfamily)